MYKAPLNIYVVWHPNFREGKQYAEAIYSGFVRDIENPLDRGMGIPVYYRSVSYIDGRPRELNLNEAEHNAVILLVDNMAILHWKDYIKELEVEVENGNREGNRIFPVSMNKSFASAGKSISEKNFIRLHEITGGFSRKKQFLLSQLSHELCRMLLNKPRIADNSQKEVYLSAEPVSLFLSHAKKDGLEIVKKIKSYTDSNKPIKTFFDSIDISAGHRFTDELEGTIERSALVVIQTDSYSSREWCRWEVLNAKKRDKPIVVINAVEEGESRSFPYLGNVPTIRWKKLATNKESLLIEKIIDFTLLEILRYVYTKKHLENLRGLVSITGTRSPKILSSPPELLTLLEKTVDHSTKGKIVIYPDPPLTFEELELLSEISDEHYYLTPTLLLAHNEI